MANGFQAKQPDYANGSCIACWKSLDVNGKEYLKVKIFGSKVMNCFKPNPKKENKEE